jgi:prepilin-type N-terminal cleavage/methylation domain-containing protein
MVEKRDKPPCQEKRHQAESGFSLIEIMIVIMLIAIVSGMAVPVAADFLQSRKADSSVVATEAAVTAARDRAIAERRNIQFTFVPPNKIRLSRVEVPTGALTQVSEFTLDNGQQLLKFAGIPDTPDGFAGAGGFASFGGTPPVMFTSDGSLIDSAGDVVNGSIFVGMPDQKDTARAVTIFGVTGLTRTWKWRGSKWME